MKAFATAFYNEKASVAAFTNYCIQEEWSIVVSFQKYRCQNRGTLVLKHTAPNCKLRICTFTPSGPFLGIGSGKVIKINSWINYLHILITKTWIPGCANKVWLIYRLRPLCPISAFTFKKLLRHYAQGLDYWKYTNFSKKKTEIRLLFKAIADH